VDLGVFGFCINGQKLKWKIPLIVVKPVHAYKNRSFGLKPVHPFEMGLKHMQAQFAKFKLIRLC
jgi:hypothetical protein